LAVRQQQDKQQPKTKKGRKRKGKERVQDGRQG
jgi:hypothetical protein